MTDTFTFVKNEGLYYKEATFAAEFCPRVVAKFHRINTEPFSVSTKNTPTAKPSCRISKGGRVSVGESDYVYQVVITKRDGTETEAEFLESLHRIPFFEKFGCPHKNLTEKQLNLLELKLQCEAAELNDSLLVSGQGLHYYAGQPFLVWGDYIISAGEPGYPIAIEDGFSISIDVEADRSQLLKTAQEFINFIPGVTEPLWYASLTGAMKPFYSSLGYTTDFVTMLAGPSGYLKTSLVKLYALWGDNPGAQLSTFRSGKRLNDIIHSMDTQVGQNYLLDDFHEAYTPNHKAIDKERLDIVVRHIGEVYNCANVIITSESSKNLGIYSCKGRLLILFIRPDVCQPLSILKPKLSKLSRTKPATIVYAFLKVLMDNYEEVLKDIINFFQNEDIIFSSELDQDTRIDHHGLFLRLTEVLFRKYFCDGSSPISGKEGLEIALRQNATLQKKELSVLREAEHPVDYPQILWQLLKEQNNYFHRVDEKDYKPEDKNSYFVKNHNIYATSLAVTLAIQKHSGVAVNKNDIHKAFKSLGLLSQDKDAPTKKYKDVRHMVIFGDLFYAYCKANYT